ncbi:hypothetical protein AYK24_02955 [Thermoplasmatales archaeon SG8-52-4]|nr:MAG: hypothetical protein AYK24_02955 [Thermoplasmatales archaeon SG8-52-4]
MEELKINVLLISPVESYYVRDYNISYGIAPPLGLLYIGKILEENDIRVNILDFSAELYNQQKLKRALNSVDIVGISLVSESTNKSKEMIDLIKEKDSEIPVIVGGSHCSLFPKKALNETGADISVQGDGEAVILDLLNVLNGKGEFSKIPGIYYRVDKNIRHGKSAELIKNLDTISFPARYLVKNYTYGYAYYPKVKKGEFTTVLTSRGCPFNCSFCSRVAACMYTYRIRSPKNILDELIEIQNQGYKRVAFMDDSLVSNKNIANKIFDLIIKEKLDLIFYVLASRADSADKELYLKMKKAGVISMKFGLESGNQDVLDFYNKRTTLDKMKNAVDLSHETGFFTHGTFIFGAPFETKKHIKKTIDFAKSLPLDLVSFLSLRYMVGSNLWFKAVDEGIISEDDYFVLADSNKNLALFSKKEIDKYCRNALRVFYLRPKYWIRLLKKSFEIDDFSILKSFISNYFYQFKKQIIRFKNISEKGSFDSKEFEI